jgi:hypothetical protein
MTDLGRGGTIAGADAKFETNIVRAGLYYRFLSADLSVQNAKPEVRSGAFAFCARG